MRKRLRVGIAVTAVLLIVSGASLWYAWQAFHHVPEFYTAALAEEPEVQRQAAEEMSSRVTMLYSDAHREGDWQAAFSADQINAWLAVDLEEKHVEALPPHIKDPRVSIDDTTITVALRIETENLNTVFSLGVEPYMLEPNELAFRLRTARAGALPIPMKDVLGYIEEAALSCDLPLRWTQVEGDPVAVIKLPPHRDEHDNALWLDKIQLQNGQIYIAGRTLPEQGPPVAGEKVWPARVAGEVRQKEQAKTQ